MSRKDLLRLWTNNGGFLILAVNVPSALKMLMLHVVACLIPSDSWLEPYINKGLSAVLLVLTKFEVAKRFVKCRDGIPSLNEFPVHGL